MKLIQQELRERIYALIKEDYDFNVEEIKFSIPSHRKFGDLSTTIPFILAKKAKKPPKAIGEDICKRLGKEFDLFSEIKVAGNGFINFYFKDDVLFNYLLTHRDLKKKRYGKQVIIEHTSINPNKSAHIGHLRNSCLGDTLARCLDFLGYKAEIQNYIDDTGIQVADVVWGLMVYKKIGLSEVKKINNLADYLWNLYPEVNKLFQQDENFLNQRNEVHKKIEEKAGAEYEMCKYISEEVLKDHIAVMNLLGIKYDVLIKESDIIAFDFFTEAKKVLEQKNIMYNSVDPGKKGCKVIKYEKGNIEKIVIRSNNTITYIGKDLAYAFWKTGLIKKNFYYEQFYQYEENKKRIFISHDQGSFKNLPFGAAPKVFNVIGIRQSYLQNIIAQVIRTLSAGRKDKKEYIHFFYEMVALTPGCVLEMGISLPEEEMNKPFIDVSGRKGIAIKADTLIKKLIQRSLQEVKDRNKNITEEKAVLIARKIAVGALRYFLIKYNSTSLIAFDFKEVLSFEGDTGPYIQYTIVRINSIIRRSACLPREISKMVPLVGELPDGEMSVFNEILLLLSKMELSVELALDNRDLSTVAGYTHQVCQKCNHYYHRFPMLAEKNLSIKKTRLAFILFVREKLEILTGLMGIQVPEKM